MSASTPWIAVSFFMSLERRDVQQEPSASVAAPSSMAAENFLFMFDFVCYSFIRY